MSAIAPPASASLRGKIAIIVGLLGAVLAVTQGPWPNDDAYITFRHARNFIEYGRLACNPSGALVMGSTSPFFALLLGIMAMPFGTQSIPTIAFILSCLAHGLTCGASFLVVTRLTAASFPGVTAGLSVALSSTSLFVAMLGFESSLLAAVVMLTLLALMREQSMTASAFAGLAPLMRPDGALLSIITLFVLAHRRAITFKTCAALFGPGLSWIGMAIPLYGSPIPQSIIAKMSFERIHWPYEADSMSMVERVGFLGVHTVQTLSTLAAILGGNAIEAGKLPLVELLLGFLFLMVACTAPLFLSRRREVILLFLYTAGWIAFYSFVGEIKLWYLPPVIPPLICALFVGTHSFSRRFGSRSQTLAALVIAVSLFSSNQYLLKISEDSLAFRARDPQGPSHEAWEQERFSSYRAAAHIAARLDSTGPALTSEIGVFSFYYPGSVIDAVGLCSPEAVTFYPPSREEIFEGSGKRSTLSNNIVPLSMIAALKPPLIVNSTFFMPRFRSSDRGLQGDYEVLHTGLTAWGEEILVLKFGMSAPSTRAEERGR